MPGELPTPTELLFRIGRTPAPLALPPWDLVGGGRFDDPRQRARFRVLYTGERRACFYECLADFRVDLPGVANQGITAAWLASRRIAAFRLQDPVGERRWLDLTSPHTFFEFRTIFSDELNLLGFTDFDVSAATSEKRLLTQAISLWAYQQSYLGIRYITRHAPSLNCWAIFEGAPFEIRDAGSRITSSDEDLRAVASEWHLQLP